MTTNYDQQKTQEEDFDFRRYGFFQKIWFYIHKFWEWLNNLYERLYPGPLFRKGAGVGALVLVVLLSIFLGIYIQIGLWVVLDIPAGIFIILTIFLVLSFVIGVIFWIFLEIPKIIGRRGLIVMGSVAAMFFLFRFPIILSVLFGVLVVFVESVFGGTIAIIFGKDFKYHSWAKKISLVVVVGIIILLHIAGFKWVKGGGSDDHLLPVKVKARENHLLQLKDPSLAGSFPVLKVSYGSGADERREEFGKDAQIITEAVDVSQLLKENMPLVKKIRRWYWGFDEKKFPLNAMVWFPKGQGPFPLVMIIHGTYRMTAHSHRGYEYLAELLAGKGFIVTAIDANFLNPSWSGSLKNEIQVRSWLVLKHLELWQKWNDNYENLFHGIVDMDNIALVGHGTGGEAVVLVALLNQLKKHPDDALLSIKKSFNIKSIVGIVPTEGHYFPGKKTIELFNVNGLFIQGDHDARIPQTAGERYFSNLSFSNEEYCIKALVYSRRANHNAFNSVWSRDDFEFPLNWITNSKALLDPADQQKLAKSYICVFLESTLKRNRSYIPLLRDNRYFIPLLPRDMYVTRFEDSMFRTLCNYEEDIDVTTGTLAGVHLEASHVLSWREGDGNQSDSIVRSNQVVFLRWGKEDKVDLFPVYAVNLPENFNQSNMVNKDSMLVFSMADCRDMVSKGSKITDPLVARIKIITDTQEVELPSSEFGSIMLPFRPRLTKLKWEDWFFKKKPFLKFQTFECPLAAFLGKVPELNVNKIKRIQFVFDGGSDGYVAFDNIGFTNPPPQ